MLKRIITHHPFLTLIVMAIAALVAGTTSLNLFYLFKANIEFIREYGIMALRDGAFSQLLELMAYGVLTVAAYIVFKACEKVLVDRLLK
ncbi:MAG: hypothetical protein ACOYJ2_03420 [Rickettsiales bacterium]